MIRMPYSLTDDWSGCNLRPSRSRAERETRSGGWRPSVTRTARSIDFGFSILDFGLGVGGWGTSITLADH